MLARLPVAPRSKSGGQKAGKTRTRSRNKDSDILKKYYLQNMFIGMIMRTRYIAQLMCHPSYRGWPVT